MDRQIIQNFIDSYSKADFDRIKFDWNGKHGDDFIDINYDFRNQVCETVIAQIDKVNLDLIRDLYIEQAKCAKETWGVYLRFNVLGQELLRRGKTKYIIDYLTGASKSQDTYMRSGDIHLDKVTSQEILEYLKEKIETETDDFVVRLIKELGLRRFEWLANRE